MRKYISRCQWTDQACRFWVSKKGLCVFRSFFLSFYIMMPVYESFEFWKCCLCNLIRMCYAQISKLDDLNSCKGTAQWMAPEV